MTTAIRAWKDPSYRASLSAQELAALPVNPAGETLSTEAMRNVLGGLSRDIIRPSNADSCGAICTATTECPFLSFCCTST